MKMFKCNKSRKHYDSNYVHKDTLQKQAHSQYVHVQIENMNEDKLNCYHWHLIKQSR